MMVRFYMEKIAIDQFAIVQKELPEGNLSLDTEISYKVSEESKAVACIVNFRFHKENEPLLILGCICFFKINPEDWESMNDGEKFKLPQETLEILAVHTIGTSRGIMYCKTEGTAYNNLIIPPLNVRDILGGQPLEHNT